MRNRWRLMLLSVIVVAFITAMIILSNRENGPSAPADCPISKPDTSDLVGHYRCIDARMPNALFDVLSDGTFRFVGSSGNGGGGEWTLEQDYAGCWELILAYDGRSPENGSAINRPLKGRRPPFG